MVVESNGGGLAEVKEEEPATNSTENGYHGYGEMGASLNISISRKGLLSNDSPEKETQDMSMVIPSRLKVLKSSSAGGGLPSPSAKFRKIADERDEISRSVPSSTSQRVRERFSGILAQKIDWGSLWDICRNWIKNPFNMALLLWISCVAISGAILFLVMTGMLDSALPKKSQRNAWFEVNNQIINALFTLMCLYQHPKRFHHLVLLCRWRPKDITTLREIYCKNGTYKPHEWAHMMVVVVLLHVNCFAQYALCSLNLGYKRSERPASGVALCLSVAIAAPAIAGVYTIISPLGKDYDSEFDEESQNHILINDTKQYNRRISLEKRFTLTPRNPQNVVEYAPEWRGGLFDLWDNIVIAYLSLFCSFCVFGWNMERLGFGNMYVHIATFLLFCVAPFWIFNLAAVTIDNEVVREALGLTGIALCIFGLLYGGFWRIKMRKRFNLPENKICCGQPAIADCTQWLFCCWCSLAQEVRTADFYDIAEDKFCRKQTDKSNHPTISPLRREDGAVWNSPGLSRLSNDHSASPSNASKDSNTEDAQNCMKAPPISSMQRADTSN